MSWLDYYKLLKKYDGDLTIASKAELKDARAGNPNTPKAALGLARIKWFEYKEKRSKKECC